MALSLNKLKRLGDAGLDLEELVATPVPLPQVVPPRFHGGVLDAVHGLSAGAARVWKSGLGYQLVGGCRRATMNA